MLEIGEAGSFSARMWGVVVLLVLWSSTAQHTVNGLEPEICASSNKT